MSTTIVVTDGEQRAALATVRALGQAGYQVIVTSTTGRSLAGASRHAVAEYATPDSLTHPTDFVDRLVQLESTLHPEILIPITEASLLAVLAAPGQITACIPFADLRAIRSVLDKELVSKVAPDHGIEVPRQRVVRSLDDVAGLQREGLAFPVVLKPARSIAGPQSRQAKVSVSYAADWLSLQASLEQLPPEVFPVLLQQRITGPGTGIFVFLADGEVLAQFAHRRLREKPPSGGVSVYRESIVADPALVDRSVALLRSLGFTGVAMVEYKSDERTGQAYLMEVNGRFWGSLQLAIDAGVNFPVLLVSRALGKPIAPVTTYRAGVRSRWWWGDVDQLLIRLRRSDEANNLPPGAPTRWQALGRFLHVWRPGDRNEVLRVSDLRPFLRETVTWFRR